MENQSIVTSKEKGKEPNYAEGVALVPIPSTSNQSPEFASINSEQNQKVRKPISHFFVIQDSF